MADESEHEVSVDKVVTVEHSLPLEIEPRKPSLSDIVTEEIERFKNATEVDLSNTETDTLSYEELLKLKKELAEKENVGEDPKTYIQAERKLGMLENKWYEALAREQSEIRSSKGKTLDEVQDLLEELRNRRGQLQEDEQRQLDEYISELDEIAEKQEQFNIAHQAEFQEIGVLNSRISSTVSKYEDEQAKISTKNILTKYQSVLEEAQQLERFSPVREKLDVGIERALARDIEKGWLTEQEAEDFRNFIKTREAIDYDDFHERFRNVPYDAWKYANAVSNASLSKATAIIMETSLGLELARFARETNASSEPIINVLDRERPDSRAITGSYLNYGRPESKLGVIIEDKGSVADAEAISFLINNSIELSQAVKDRINKETLQYLLGVGASRRNNSLIYEKTYAFAPNEEVVVESLILLSLNTRDLGLASSTASAIRQVSEDESWESSIENLIQLHPELSNYREWLIKGNSLSEDKGAVPTQEVIDKMVGWVEKSGVAPGRLVDRCYEVASTELIADRLERRYVISSEYRDAFGKLKTISESASPELQSHAMLLTSTMREVMILKSERRADIDWDEICEQLLTLSDSLVDNSEDENFVNRAKVLFSKEFLKAIHNGQIGNEAFSFVRDTLSIDDRFVESNALRSVFFSKDASTFLTEDRLSFLNKLQGYEGITNEYAAELIELGGGVYLPVPDSVVEEFARRISRLDSETIAAAFQNRFVYLESVERLNLLEELSAAFGGRKEVLAHFALDLQGEKNYDKNLARIREIATQAPDFAKNASEWVISGFLGDSEKIIHGPEDWKFLNEMSLRIPNDLENIMPFYAQAYENGTITADNRIKLFELIDNVRGNSPQLLETPGMYKLIFSDLGRFIEMPPEKLSTYLAVFQRIEDSPSQEVQRIKEQLLSSVFEADNPEEVFNQIEQVFISSTLQCVNRFKVFDLLHSQKMLEEKVATPHISPLLREIPADKLRTFMFNELLRVQIYSGNRELRDFLKDFDNTGDGTSPSLSHLRNIVSFLSSHPDFANGAMATPTMEESELTNVICSKLGCTPDAIAISFVEKVLVPIGFESYEKTLSAMEGQKKEAHLRGMAYAEAQDEGVFNLHDGDLIKSVDSSYLGLISQDGSVAKEFLGASAASDRTPLDTDLTRISQTDIENGKSTKNILNQSISGKGSYGDIYIVARSRNQFTQTTDMDEFNRLHKPHVFKSGVLGKQHEGITIGFPLTDADFLIATPSIIESPNKLNKLCFEIAKNGYYIPVVDQEGQVIFTPEQYTQYRETFSGLSYYEGEKYEVNRTTEDEPHYHEIQRLAASLEQQRQEVQNAYLQIGQLITSVLGEDGITLKDKSEALLLDPELSDTGSTGRGTNLPPEWTKSIDFDLSLMLATIDFKKSSQIIDKLRARLSAERYEQYGDAKYQQIRMYGAKLPDGTSTDIDIGLVKKSRLRGFESHEAIASKLDTIQETQGEEVYREVVANIILTKKLLKDAHAYKKQEDGGLGGIGIETWVLQHHGNMVEAFLQFRKAAYKDGGKVGLNEFKKRYQIWDSGINIKSGAHDNYTERLTEVGYNNMLNAVETYLRDNDYNF